MSLVPPGPSRKGHPASQDGRPQLHMKEGFSSGPERRDLSELASEILLLTQAAWGVKAGSDPRPARLARSCS